MTIAVTADIYPSRLMAGLVGLACFGILLLALAMLSLPLGALDFSVRAILATGLLIVAMGALIRFFWKLSAWRLHIDGAGQMQLTPLGKPLSNQFKRKYAKYDLVFQRSVESFQRSLNTPVTGELVELQDCSLIWPWIMILHFRFPEASKRGKQVLIVTPDSVSATTFRALSIAMRWIARRKSQ